MGLLFQLKTVNSSLEGNTVNTSRNKSRALHRFFKWGENGECRRIRLDLSLLNNGKAGTVFQKYWRTLQMGARVVLRMPELNSVRCLHLTFWMPPTVLYLGLSTFSPSSLKFNSDTYSFSNNSPDAFHVSSFNFCYSRITGGKIVFPLWAGQVEKKKEIQKHSTWNEMFHNYRINLVYARPFLLISLVLEKFLNTDLLY